MNNKNINIKGFTLIELIVVMAVFLLVIGGAITIFISIVQHQRQILAEDQLLNQVSYVQEYMSKALRMAKAEADEDGECLVDSTSADPGLDHLGYIYLLTRYDAGSSMFKGIKFINQSDTDPETLKFMCQEFFIDVASATDSRLVLWEKRGSNPPVAITSPDLQINYIKFGINGKNGSSEGCTSSGLDQCGASNEDSIQPRATILLNIQIPGDSQNSPEGIQRIIQTTVSQRNLNAK